MTQRNVSSTLVQRLASWSAKLFYWRQSELGDFKSVKKTKASPKPPVKKDYQGPLYAPHPDIKKKK